MQQIYYELSVLSKAIHFKNLSAAALHVGLSQPQLSRIIAKIEDELKVIILDRSAKRKSGWTPIAYQLSEIFQKSVQRLEAELHTITTDQMIAELRIGALEGLMELALKISRQCFEHLGLKKIVLDIFDLSDLEANFLSGNLDVVFTSKSPGRQKFQHLEEFGYQTFEKVETNKQYGVYSTFEFGRTQKKEIESFEHILISNSLIVKKEWLKTIGGVGYLPGDAKKGRSKDAEPVMMIGSELLSPILWNEIVEAIKKD